MYLINRLDQFNLNVIESATVHVFRPQLESELLAAGYMRVTNTGNVYENLLTGELISIIKVIK